MIGRSKQTHLKLNPWKKQLNSRFEKNLWKNMQSLVFAATPGFWVPWDLTFHRNHATGMSHNTSFFIGKDYHKSNEINAQAGNGLKSTSQSIRITWGAAGTVAGGTSRFFIPTGTFILCLVVVWRLEDPSVICQPNCQFCIIPLQRYEGTCFEIQVQMA